MHSPLLTVAGAGLGVILLATSPANAITLTAPSGVRLAAAPLALIEAVHCRRYLHWHSREQRRSRGCGDDTQSDSGRGSGVARAGVGISTLPRVGAPASSVRSPGNYRNPSNPQDRSGSSNRQDMMQPRAFNPQDMR
jgi:hypothetical protein